MSTNVFVKCMQLWDVRKYVQALWVSTFISYNFMLVLHGYEYCAFHYPFI